MRPADRPLEKQIVRDFRHVFPFRVLPQISSNGWRKLLGKAVAVVMIAAASATIACTPKIPNEVTNEEINLYREWLKQYFVNDPEQLYLDDQTFVFDPVQSQCDVALRRTDHVSRRLIKQLHALGRSDFPLNIDSTSLKLPWPYKILDPRKFPVAPAGKVHVISFSRVAFSGDHREALFAIGDSCGSDCGAGSAVLATMQGSGWRFRRLESCAGSN